MHIGFELLNPSSQWSLSQRLLLDTGLGASAASMCGQVFLSLTLFFAQVYPPIKLKKANMRLDRMAAKVVGGVGSAAKSARRIVARIGSAPDGGATPQQAS